jgi:hypothetical protein
MQMLRQPIDSSLKQQIMFKTRFTEEEILVLMNDYFQEIYKYPSLQESQELIQFHQEKQKQ